MEYPDWAILTLDRDVMTKSDSGDLVPRIPMKVDFFPSLNDPVYRIGCDTGTAVKVGGLGTATIKKIGLIYIEEDTCKLGGDSGGPVINAVTHKAIAITSRGYTDYVIDKQHLEQTGQKRVITRVITKEEIESNEYGYSISQRLHFDRMFDFNDFFEVNGHELRDKLSNQHSEKFVSELNSEISFEETGIKLNLFGWMSLITAPINIAVAITCAVKMSKLKSILRDLEYQRDFLRIYGADLNLLEAKHQYDHFNQLNDYTVLRVKNMAAYNLSKEEVINLENQGKI